MPANARSPEATPATPRLLGIWRLLEPLHRGQYCSIFTAQPADASGSPRADYVVKTASSLESEAQARRLIRNEAAAAVCTRNPNLVPVLDADVDGAAPYLVQPRIEGVTLQQSIADQSQRIPVLLWWTRQTASALLALHTAGWRHGDVKPENILVGPRGHLTLIDLGFAAPLDARHSDRALAGTPDYAAPEIGRGGKIDAAADVYALGCVLQQMLQAQPRIPVPVKELRDGMLADDPRQRPSAEVIIGACLRLEIETLGEYISPIAPAPRRAAA